MEHKKTTGHNKKGRICVIRLAYYPGDARVPKEVRALCESGYEVDVICLRDKGQSKQEKVQDAQVYRVGLQHRRRSLLGYLYEYLFGFLATFVLVNILFFRRRYHCIQVNTLPDVLVFVALIPRLFGAKVLLDMHEPTPELFMTKYSSHKYCWKVKLIAILEQISLRFATAVLTVNETIKQRFVERGTPAEKIHVVRNVPEQDFRTESDGITTDHFQLLIHGLISERYGQETAIRAVKLVRDKIRNIRLVIAGPGDNKERMEQLTRELGCDDIVHFTGWVPIPRIKELIGVTDVGLVPLLRTPFSELCQPNKLFELVSSQTAVIVPRLEAIEESFDESCAMFFEPGDSEDLARCIMGLYNDPAKREQLAENGYRRYTTISWMHSKRTYLQVVNGLLRTKMDKCDVREETGEIHLEKINDTKDNLSAGYESDILAEDKETVQQTTG